MKKALSLLLAVLMLVSLFSGMAFADDDVIVEEPADDVIAEEPAATDEFVGDDYVEAADAFVEEYTDEGSFEAANDWQPAEIYKLIDHVKHEIDRVESKDGTILGTTVDSMPKTHGTEFFVFVKTYDDAKQVWGDPVKYEVTVPHNWGDPVLVLEGEASCTEGGYFHYETKCLGYPVDYAEFIKDPVAYRAQGGKFDGKCTEVVKSESQYLPMQGHTWEQDKTYTGEGIKGDDRAIIIAPTCQEDGLGNYVCSVCGAYAWDVITLDGGKTWVDPTYPIYRMTEPDAQGNTERYTGKEGQKLDPKYHDYGDFTVIKEATCLTNGTKAHYCNLCKFQQTVDIPAYNHYLKPTVTGNEWQDLTDPYSAMVFDHIERVDCDAYVEVWTCCIDGCKAGVKGTPFSVFVGAKTPASVDTERVIIDVKGNTEKALDVKTVDPAQCFMYTKTYKVDFNTEHYAHHRYSTEWIAMEPAQPAKCCVEGTERRICLDHPNEVTHEDYRPIPAILPDYTTVVFTQQYDPNTGAAINTPDDGTHVFVHFVRCTHKDCNAAAYVPEFGKDNSIKVTDPEYFTQDNVKDPAEGPALSKGMLVDHDWGEWTVYVAPTATTLGHWTRTCKYEGCHAVEEFVGTQAEFEAMLHPVLKTGIYKEDGAFKLYEMGMFDADFTGIFDGYNDILGQTGKWYVENGIWKNNAMGATLVGSTWYFLANGKVQEVTQLAEYQGKWFYVVNGVIDTSKTALVDYNGGKFVVAKGRIVDEYNGLWQNAKSIGGDDSWYYVANGQVQTQYTGLVLYDGEWFYVENGQLVPYNGEVEYDGEIFNVKEGMVVAA